MKRASVGFMVLVLLSGCGAGRVSSSDAPADDGDALATSAVKVISQGNWSEVLGCSGQCEQRFHFWADLSVRNDAYQKDVGARWSADGWKSFQTVQASYVGDLGNGYEKWHLEAVIGEGTSQPDEVEFAVYASMNGTTSWDPNNNYYVYQSVSADEPVRLLRSGVSYASRTGVSLSGAVRVYDLGNPKTVSIRYTTDGWATWKDAFATWSTANDWTFKIPNVAHGKPLPSDVEFAVRYQVAGQDLWDNNGGANYRLQLEPTFRADTAYVSSLDDLSGIITLGALWDTNLPVASYQARVDSKTWQTDARITFSTLGLADGAHHVEFKLKAVGGYTATATVPFTVHNQVAPFDAWKPPYANASPGSVAPWAAAAGSDGKLYVNWSDGHVVRYDAWGQTSDGLAYDAAPGNIQTIALDAQGRLYALATYPGFALYRYDASGHLDPSFSADLTQSFDGTPICYVSAVAALGSDVQVADSCNERVLDFDARGNFVNAIGTGDATAIVSLNVADGALWAGDESGFSRFDLGSSGLQLGARMPVAGLNGPAGLASAGGHFWVVDNISRLTALNTDGSIAATWLGGTGSFGLQGEIPLARGLTALPDGSIAVVATDDGALVRFDSALK